MAVFTLRLPDNKHRRLKYLAQRRGIGVNRLIEEMVAAMIVAFDAETRFRARAVRGRGKAERGLALLDKAARKA